MKIQLFYKEILLGELEFQDSKYSYSSSASEKDAFGKYKGLVDYNLKDSLNLKSENLFDFFSNHFIKPIKQIKKLSDMLEISNENDFDILLKYAQLKQNQIGYHIKVKD